MKKLSVCILVKNEERTIKDCLDSIKDVADEILVVDNGSTDATIQILRTYNCKIIDGSGLLLDDARKLYIKKAIYDWILIIDADERLEKSHQEELRKIINRTNENVWGIELQSYQYTGLGNWSEITALRLVRNKKCIKYNKSAIHASLSPSILDNGGDIIVSDITLHHIDILLPERTQGKRKRYKELLKQTLSNGEMDIDYNMYYLYKCFLALEYVAEANYYKAEKLYLEAINQPFRFQNFAIALLCQLYIITNQYNKIGDYVKEEYMDELIITNVLGNYYVYLDFLKALEYYKEQIEINPRKVSNYINLAFLEYKNGNVSEAINLVEIAFSMNSYLAKKVIYLSGEKPNIYDVQNSILFSIGNVYSFIELLGLDDKII